MNAYRDLLSPLTIKGVTLKNRVVSTAHAPGYAEAGLENVYSNPLPHVLMLTAIVVGVPLLRQFPIL